MKLFRLCQMGFNASAKNTEPCQPAQSVQANIVRNVSLSLDFLLVKRPFYIELYLVGCLIKLIEWI